MERLQLWLATVVSEGDSTTAAWIFDRMIVLLIISSTTVAMLETVPELADYYSFFYKFEYFTAVIFGIEWSVRLWTAPIRFKHSSRPRFKYAFSLMSLIDLIAFLPSLVPFIVGVDLQSLRTVRLLRFLRILKLARYSDAIKTFSRVMKQRSPELTLSFGLMFVLLLMASTLMYYVEHEAQPEAFKSIPHTMWWAVATLTTVGYGDIYPVTALGKILGSIVAITGMGFFALPAGIIAAGFAETFREKAIARDIKYAKANGICPHCKSKVQHIKKAS